MFGGSAREWRGPSGRLPHRPLDQQDRVRFGVRDGEWRQQMWGQVVALHGRYPLQLQALKDEWWTDESQTETLCALALWRAELDDTGQDPREELAFQNQLVDYTQLLRQQGGGVTKAWKPGAPPAEWAGG